MATAPESKDENDDLLTCTICLETFNVPKYLPCLHSFCETCIKTYIASTIEKEKDQTGFSCPVCRSFVPMEETSVSWAEKLPKNHLIISMLDKRAIDRSEKLCDVCVLSSVTQSAVSWCTVCQEAFCTGCENFHRKFKMSSKHKIITMQEAKSEKSSQMYRAAMCEEHSEKFVEIYCADHNQPCCTVCATVKHRKCEKVIAIQEAVSGVKKSTKVIDLSNQLEKWRNILEKSITMTQENVSTIESNSTDISNVIDELKSKILKHLTEISEISKNDLTAKKKYILTQLNDKTTELSSLKSTIENWQKIINTCVEHGSEVQCFLEVNRLEAKSDELTSRMKTCTSKLEKHGISFRPLDTIEDFENKVKSFGDVGVYKANMQNGKVHVLFSVDTGGGGCSVSGIFVGDLMVLTNCEEKETMTFDNKGKLLGKTILSCNPYDICHIRNNVCAISSVKETQIFFINITNMNIEKILKCAVSLLGGICYLPDCDLFLVSFSKKLTWIDAATGKTRTEKQINGENFYSYSKQKDDYIYTDSNKTVSRVTNEAIVFNYTSQQLSAPRGIDVDFEGNVYICGYHSNNIHQLSSSGDLIRIIPSSEQPWVIRFKENSNRFLLTSFSSGKVVICEIR